MGNTTRVVYADQLSYHVGIRWEILHVVYADQLSYHVGIRWEILHVWYMLINYTVQHYFGKHIILVNTLFW